MKVKIGIPDQGQDIKAIFQEVGLTSGNRMRSKQWNYWIVDVIEDVSYEQLLELSYTFGFAEWYYAEDDLPSLEKLKEIKKHEFQPILNDFTLLMDKCQKIKGNDNTELNALISMVTKVKDLTIQKIDGYTDVVELSKFGFKPKDIARLKAQFKPFEL